MRHGLDVPADLPHLLSARYPPGFWHNNLQIVDKNHLVAVGQRIRADVRHGHAGGLDDVNGPLDDLFAFCGQERPLLLRDGPTLDFTQLDPGQVGHKPIRQFVAVGLQAVKADPVVLREGPREAHAQRRFAGGRVAADDHHVPQLGEELLIQLPHPPGKVLMGGFVALVKLLEHGGHVHVLRTLPPGEQPVELGYDGGRRVQVLGILERPARLRDPCKPCLLKEYGNIAPDICGSWGAVHDVHEQLAPGGLWASPQLVPHSDGINRPSIHEQAANGLIDPAASPVNEIIRPHLREYLADQLR